MGSEKNNMFLQLESSTDSNVSGQRNVISATPVDSQSLSAELVQESNLSNATTRADEVKRKRDGEELCVMTGKRISRKLQENMLQSYVCLQSKEGQKIKAGIVLMVEGGVNDGKMLLIQERDGEEYTYPFGDVGDQDRREAAFRIFNKKCSFELLDSMLVSEWQYLNFYYALVKVPYFYLAFTLALTKLHDFKFVTQVEESCNFFTRMFTKAIRTKKLGDVYENFSISAQVGTFELVEADDFKRVTHVDGSSATTDLNVGIGVQTGRGMFGSRSIELGYYVPKAVPEKEVYSDIEDELESDSEEEQMERFFLVTKEKEFPDRVDWNCTGYGVHVTDHMWGRSFMSNASSHVYGCCELCYVCYPMNTGAVDYWDELRTQYLYDESYCNFHKLCTCDGYMTCDLCYLSRSNSYSSGDYSLWDSQINNEEEIEREHIHEILREEKRRALFKCRSYNKREWKEELNEALSCQMENDFVTKRVTFKLNTIDAGRINIGNLRHYFSALRKGEQHAVLIKMKKTLNNDFVKTYYTNSNTDCVWLANLYKNFKIECELTKALIRKRKNDKFSAQLFGDLVTSFKETISGASNSIKKVAGLPGRLDDLAQEFSGLGTKMNASLDFITNIQGTFQSYSTGAMAGLVRLLTQFVSMGILLCEKANRTPLNIACICANALSGLVPLSNLLDCLVLAVQGALEYFIGNSPDVSEVIFQSDRVNIKAQMGVEQQGKLTSLISAVFDIVKNTFFSCFGGIPQDEVDSLSMSTKFVATVVKGMSSIKSIVLFFMNIFSECISYFSEFLLEHYGFVPWFLKDKQKLDQLVEDFRIFETENVYESSKRDIFKASFVRSLYSRITTLEAALGKKVLQRDRITCMPYIQAMKNKVGKAYSTLPPHFKGDVGSKRPKPFWLSICGQPRIGKTTWFQNIVVNCLAKACGVLTSYQDPTTYCHSRECGAEFWEGYYGQPFTVYDDLFQTFTDETLVNNGIRELTAVINDAAYPLNMANLESKGCTFFNSPIVISNMQKDFVGQSYIKNKCLSGGEHLFARRNVVAELNVDPKYMLTNGTLNTDLLASEQILQYNVGDPLVYKIIPKDAYHVKFYNPATGKVYNSPNVGPVVPIDMAIDIIVALCKEHFVKCGQINDRVNETMKEMYAQMAENDEDFPEENASGSFFSADAEFEFMNWERILYIYNGVYLGAILANGGFFKPLATIAVASASVLAAMTLDQLISLYLEYKNDQTGRILVRSYIIGYTTCKCGKFLGECLETFENESGKILNYVKEKTHECSDNCFQLLDRAMAYVKTEASSFCCAIKNKLNEWYDSFQKFIVDNKWLLLGAVGAMIGTAVIFYKLYYTRMNECENENWAQSHEKGTRRAKRKNRRENKVKKPNHGIHDIDEKTIVIGNAQVYNEQNQVSEKLIDRSLLRVSILLNDNGKLIETNSHESAMNVAGNILMFPKHMWHRVSELVRVYDAHNVAESKKNENEKRKVKVLLRLRWDDSKMIDVPVESVRFLDPLELDDCGHLKDICFIQIKGINAGRDLSGKFVSYEDEVSCTGAYLYGIRSKAKSLSVTPTVITLNNCTLITKKCYTTSKYSLDGAVDPIFGKNLSDIDYVVSEYYQYNAPTVYGDCGMLLMHADSKVNAKICGIHVAGSQDKQIGLAIPLYSEDIEDVIEYFGGDDVIRREGQMGILSLEEGVTPFHRDVKSTELRVYGPVGKLNVDGKDYDVRRRMADGSKITKSACYDVLADNLGEAKSAPAQMRPFIKDGVKVSPMLKALEKMTRFGKYLDVEELEEAVQHAADSIRSWNSPHLDDKRILTEYEMINGYEGLNPIDITTSPGFPFVLTRMREGKKDYFEVKKDNSGKDRYYLKDNMRAYMDKREDLARHGVIGEMYWTDTLKDETRPLAKVESGQTRLFQIGPMDLTLLTRKYCGKFMSHCQSTYLDGEMAIGISPYSDDWDMMCRNMMILKKFLNGDYKHYDASITFQLGEAVADVINLIYDDGPENMRIRKALILSCFSADHLVGDTVYEALQGHPSGCALTAILNCIVNMILIRIAFRRTTGMSLDVFHDLVKPKFYGDDNWVGIHERIQSMLNMFTYTKVMADLGFIYTSPDKGEMTVELYDADNISFLKNKIWYCESLGNFYLGKYLAVLEMETITEIARWSQSDANNMLDQMNRFNMSLYFVKNHGRSEFDKLRKIFLKCIDDLRRRGFGIEYKDLFHWQHVMMLQHPEYKINLNRTSSDVVKDDDAVLDLLGDWEVGKLFTQSSLDSSYQNSCISTNNELNGKLNEILNELRENKNFDMYKREIVSIWQKFLNEENENSIVAIKSNNARDRRWLNRHAIEAQCGQLVLNAQVGDEPVTEITEGLTTFEENAVESTETISTKGLSSVAYAASLERFILRPYLYSSINWTATDVPFTNLLTISLPNDLLTAVDTLRSKVEGFAFWRPSFEVTLRVNGTMMHYGRLVCYWLPQAGGLSAAYKDTRSGFTGNFIQVDANGSNVAKLVIPYTHYQDCINVGHVNVDLATVYIDVAAALSSIASTPASIHVGVFIRVTEHGLKGFNYHNDWVAQMGDMNEFKCQMYSEVARKARDFAGAVMNVTSLNAYVPPMRRLAGMALNVLDFLGLSNPINKGVTNSMQIRQPLYMHGVDTPNSINMATDMDSTISKDLSYVNSYPGETDIVNFCSRVGLLRLGTITSSLATGTTLESIIISPVNFVNSSYLGPPDYLQYSPTPVCYMAKFFAMWRGSFKFTLSFIKSNFHNARIRISYIPYESDAGFPAFDSFAEDDVEGIIVDLSNQSEVTFIIPYQQRNDWSWVNNQVNSTLQSEIQNNANGRLVISVVNQLTSGTTPVTPIYYQLFVSACEDIQFAQPTMKGIENSGYQAQIGEMIGDGECTFQACSSDNLRSVKGKILGVDNAHISNNASTTNTIGSTLNLSKMLSYLANTVFLQSRGYRITPSAPAYMRTNGTYYNFMLQMQSVYRYWKGGVRFSIVPMRATDTTYAASIQFNYNESYIDLALGTTPYFTEPIDMSCGLVVCPVLSRNPFDVILPFNNVRNCFPTQTGQTGFSRLGGSSLVIRAGGPDEPEATILMGAADDYLLGFQLQIPLCNEVTNS